MLDNEKRLACQYLAWLGTKHLQLQNDSLNKWTSSQVFFQENNLDQATYAHIRSIQCTVLFNILIFKDIKLLYFLMNAMDLKFELDKCVPKLLNQS